MLRRIRRWWKQNAMLMFGNGIIGIFPLFLKLQEIGASPQKRAKIEEFRRQYHGMRQQLNDFNKELDRAEEAEPDDRSIKMLSALEKFQQEHGPEGLDRTRRWKREAIARKGEHATLDAIRSEAGEDTTKLIDDLREYLVEHPNSNLAEANLIGAFRKAERYSEALAHARKLFEREEGDDINGIRKLGRGTVVATILTEKGEPREAVFFLEKLLAEYPQAETVSRVIASTALADAYEKSNNRDEARKIWKQVASYSEYKELAKKAKENLKRLS